MKNISKIVVSFLLVLTVVLSAVYVPASSYTYTCVEDIAVSSPIGTDENTELLSEDPLKNKEE